MSLFAVVADDTRRGLMEALGAGERTVTQLQELLGVSQPSVSKHLRVLREAGLVSVTAKGPLRWYRLNPGPLRELDEWLAAFRPMWSDRLDALESHLATTEDRT